jgi:hypothetical protein
MSIIEQTVQSALRLLKATKAKYIIVLPDGTMHSTGDLQLETAKVYKRKPGGLPLGTYAAMCKPHVGMAVGDVAEFDIPKGGNKAALRSAVSAYFSTAWGAGSAKTCFNKNTQKVEMLRVG